MTVMSLWQFSKWGIDFLGPFPLVPIDYLTKLVEAEPLSTITIEQAQKFFWSNIFTRFKVLESMVIDNRTQFTD